MNKDFKSKIVEVSIAALIAGIFYAGVVLAALPQPTLNFRVAYDLTSITIPYNTSTLLVWSSTETQFCIASGAWSGYKPVTAGTHTDSTGNLLTSKVYTLTCTGNDNSIIQRSVTVNIQQPTLIFTAGSGSLTDIVIPYNTGITINWISTNATECNATLGSNTWPGLKNLSGSFFTGNLIGVKIYTLTCTNPAGSIEKSVTVSAPEPGHTSESCRWYVSSSSPGGTEISCNGAGRGDDPEPSATTCTLSNEGDNYMQTFCSGGISSETYWQCTCAPLFTSDSLNFNATPAKVAYGKSSTLTWSAPEATSGCYAGGGPSVQPYTWPGYKPKSGTFSTGPLTATQTYNIACSALTGPARVSWASGRTAAAAS